MESVLLDLAGHRRSPATMPGYHRGRHATRASSTRPTVEEIVAVMRMVGDRADGHRLRALVVLLWRAGLRISEALSLQESDLDRSRLVPRLVPRAPENRRKARPRGPWPNGEIRTRTGHGSCRCVRLRPPRPSRPQLGTHGTHGTIRPVPRLVPRAASSDTGVISKYRGRDPERVLVRYSVQDAFQHLLARRSSPSPDREAPRASAQDSIARQRWRRLASA